MSDVGIIPVNFTGYLLAMTEPQMVEDEKGNRCELVFIIMTERSLDPHNYHAGVVYEGHPAFVAVSQLKPEVPADAADLLGNGATEGTDYLIVKVLAKGFRVPVPEGFRVAGTSQKAERFYVITDLNRILPD